MSKKKRKQEIEKFAYVNKDGVIVELNKFDNAALAEFDISVSPTSCIGVYAADCETYGNNVIGVNKTAVWSLATTPVIPRGHSYNYSDVNTISDACGTDCINEWLNYILSRSGADYLIKLKEEKDYVIYELLENVAYISFNNIPDDMLKYIYYVGKDVYLHLNVVTVYFHNLNFDGNFIGSYLEENSERLGLSKEYIVDDSFYTKQNVYSTLYNLDSRNFIYMAIHGEGNTILFIKDSGNLLRDSLENIAKDFNTTYKKLKMNYDEHRPGEELTEDMKKYIANDVLSLAEIVYGLLTNGMVQLTATSFAFTKLKEHIGKSKFYQLFPNQYTDYLLKNEEGYIFRLKSDGTLDEATFMEDLCNAGDNLITADDFCRGTYKGGLVLLRDNKLPHIVKDDDVYAQNDSKHGLDEVRTSGRGVALDCTSMYAYIQHSKSGTYFPVKHPIYLYSKDELCYTYMELYDILKDGVKIIDAENVKSYVNNSAYLRSALNLANKLDWDKSDTAINYLSRNIGVVMSKDLQFDYECLPVYRFLKIRCSFRLKDDGIPCIIEPSLGPQSTSFIRGNKTISSYGNIVELTLTQVDYELFVENYNIDNFEAIQMIEYEAKIGLFDEFVNKYFEAKRNSKGVHRALNKAILTNSMGRMGKKKIEGVSIPYLDEKGSLSFELNRSLKVEQVYAYVPVAAALTSAARKFVVYAIKKFFPTTFNYTDTDSLKIEESLKTVEEKVKNDDIFKLGRELGEWKNDLGDGVEFSEAVYLKLKTYLCVVGEDYHITAAGITKRATSLMEAYFKLSNKLLDVKDDDEFVELIVQTLEDLELKDIEVKWFRNQIDDDKKLRRNNECDIAVGIDKFHLGYTAPPQLKAKRVENGVILDYFDQHL